MKKAFTKHITDSILLQRKAGAAMGEILVDLNMGAIKPVVTKFVKAGIE